MVIYVKLKDDISFYKRWKTIRFIKSIISVARVKGIDKRASYSSNSVEYDLLVEPICYDQASQDMLIIKLKGVSGVEIVH